MRVKLGLTLVGLLSVCSMAAVGCGADDDDDGSGGRGGSGGTAGSSGKGGKAGKGGTAGEAGAAGKGGSGGTSSGGKGGSSGRGGSGGTAATSGESGAGGQAGGGEGGAVGGEAGASACEAGAGGAGAMDGEGGAGGATGEAGGGGAGGEQPIETASFCSYGCDTTEDCSASIPSGYECHPTRKRCEDPATSCDVAADCYAMVGFWFMNCANDAECMPGNACVRVRDVGYCAEEPVEGACLFGDILTVARFGAEGTVQVCGESAVYCDENHQCTYGCESDDDCPMSPGTGNTCNLETHRCECSDSSECSDGASVCNPTTGRCECASDADCAELPSQPNRNHCVAGVCGCSDATVCAASPFAGAEVSCR